MRKILLVAVSCGALFALAPATALAKHHGRRHHALHARIHHRRIGDPTSTSTPSPIGTVASFDTTTGTLKLTLTDGTTLSGMVTNDTRLVCVPPPSTTQPTSGGDDDQGDQAGGSDAGDQTGSAGQSQGDDDQGQGDDQSQGDDQGQGDDDQGQGDDDQGQTCSTSNLVSPTPVLFLNLSMSSAGTTFNAIVLQTTPSTTPTVPDTDNDGS